MLSKKSISLFDKHVAAHKKFTKGVDKASKEFLKTFYFYKITCKDREGIEYKHVLRFPCSITLDSIIHKFKTDGHGILDLYGGCTYHSMYYVAFDSEGTERPVSIMDAALCEGKKESFECTYPGCKKSALYQVYIQNTGENKYYCEDHK